MSSQREIYRGLWTNWANGPVLGATLTLSQRNGAYLIAFLALFVHVAGASFWRLVSFAIFHLRAHPELKERTVLQQQAVLRNSASAISGLRGFAEISIRSRGLRRNALLIIWSSLNVIGFLGAGILSSKVTSTGSDVLLKPSRCGRWWDCWDNNIINPTTKAVQETVCRGTISNLQAASSKFASTCYSGNGIPNSCSSPARRTLSWNASESYLCPFGDLCSDMTLSLDSGFIASDLDLGINSSPTDRIGLRLGLQCAPLKQDQYMKTYYGNEVSSLINNVSWRADDVFFEPTDQFQFEAFFYGPSTWGDTVESSASFIFNNGTIARSMTSQFLKPSIALEAQSAEFALDGQLFAGRSSFIPIPQLVVPGRHISLFFLSIGRWYSKKIITDPWFKLDQRLFEYDVSQGSHEPIKITAGYTRQPYTTVLGCSSKSEMCRGTSDANRKCAVVHSDGTPHGEGTIAENLGLNEKQRQVAQRVRDAHHWSTLASLAMSTGGPGLLASQYFNSDFGAPLPHNQWTLEVKNWFASVLVMLQYFTAEYVTGLSNTKFDANVTLSKKEEWMCHNQVIQSTDYASFSVLGVCIIVLIGTAFIGSNMVDDRLCRLVLAKTELNEYRASSWDASGLLELQAAALRSRKSEASSTASSRASSRAAEFDVSRNLKNGHMEGE